MSDNEEVMWPKCSACDGEGVYVESCDSEDCPPNCPGHEVVCGYCHGGKK